MLSLYLYCNRRESVREQLLAIILPSAVRQLFPVKHSRLTSGCTTSLADGASNYLPPLLKGDATPGAGNGRTVSHLGITKLANQPSDQRRSICKPWLNYGAENHRIAQTRNYTLHSARGQRAFLPKVGSW
ncbi:hypothetical protein BaRGS_00002620 [Batillaria attramentaria]|uniref:Uncharacterized protein n=1 Tax=Batillaria attramentaria TaxID=370345 RepID=A0ABD0M2J4_9CAEN